MAERQNAERSWLAWWRERRRVKRQQAFERQRFEHERARSAGGAPSTPSAYQHRAPVGGWLGFGGDGGGCGGDGGGCGGGDGGGC